MKAYVYGANGAEIADVAKPSPKGTQVLVKVHACGLNRADLGMTKGHVHGAAGGVGTVLGMEWAGEVAELGPEAKGVKVGDKIMGSGGAAFAEYTLADHGRLFRAPSNMNFEEAATLPVALATMHNAVVTNGALQAGQTVLIQGASSGVGLMAMQIAKLKGAKTRDRLLDRRDAARTAEGVRRRSRDRLQRSRLGRSGAEGDRRRRRRPDRRSGLRPASPTRISKATKVKGRIVNVGRLGGTHADFNFDLHAARRINYIGVTFRTRSIEEIREIFDEVRKDIWAGGGIAKTAIADRQGLSVRRHRQGVRAHGSQQAPRQDRGDAVARCTIAMHVLDGGRYFEGPRWHAGRLWFVDCMERTLLSLCAIRRVRAAREIRRRHALRHSASCRTAGSSC